MNNKSIFRDFLRFRSFLEYWFGIHLGKFGCRPLRKNDIEAIGFSSYDSLDSISQDFSEENCNKEEEKCYMVLEFDTLSSENKIPEYPNRQGLSRLFELATIQEDLKATIDVKDLNRNFKSVDDFYDSIDKLYLKLFQEKSPEINLFKVYEDSFSITNNELSKKLKDLAEMTEDEIELRAAIAGI